MENNIARFTNISNLNNLEKKFFILPNKIIYLIKDNTLLKPKKQRNNFDNLKLNIININNLEIKLLELMKRFVERVFSSKKNLYQFS